MTPERWKKIDELFEAALEVDSSQRSDFLAEACEGDTQLRSDVERLLKAHEKAKSFIEEPPVDEAASLFFDSGQSSVVGREILHYSVLSSLGAGGMGQVYLARDLRLGRRVALKLLPGHSTSDREIVRRFQQEASAASALNHPNILTIYEVAQEDQLHFIVSEYIEGVTLRERMREQRLTLAEALDFAIQITGALAAAHNAGIVHRDIKPENVMIRPDGLVKVLDFGLAKLTQPAEESGKPADSSLSDVHTDPGTVMGTVHYMSPEQARAKPIDARSDVFATGVLLYEMLSGKRPFSGESTSDVLVSILEKPHAPLRSIIPSVPPDLDRILDRALAKQREHRHAHAGELLSDLSKLKRDLETASIQKPASCPICRKENPPGFAFCTGCGTALKKICPACRELVSADNSFCGFCGHRFTGMDSLPSDNRITEAMGAAQSQTMSASGAERRRATVVYAIVSGCAAILEQFEPEQADRAIAGIKQAVAEVINAHGGIVDRCSGEELVALFGIPASYEDDFVRAARAALALRDRIAELSRDVEARLGHPLRIYAAINSGPVVTRLSDDGRYTVSGEPLQIASRLAGRADAGEILIGPETQRLIAPFFTLEATGAFSPGANSRPVSIHRLTGETGVRTRLEAAQAFGLTRHTARERELAELNSMLEKTLAGEGQFVTVVGDAGVGKSRLLLEFRRALEVRQIPMLVGRCQPNKRNIPYLPFIDVLTDLLKLRDETEADRLRTAAISGIETIDDNLAAYIPVYLHLLSIQSDEHQLPDDLKGDHLTLSILEALSAIITLNSRRLPSVVVLEDWHWADEGSEEAVRRLGGLAASYPLMVIVSFRPERVFDWGYVDANAIQLSPLDEASTVKILQSMLDARKLPTALARLLFSRTGGNPFFIEEVCRTLMESGRIRVLDGVAAVEGRISDLDVPETVQAVIRTRLDRLDLDSQRVLRYASIIGREFSLPLLEAMSEDGKIGSCLEMLQKHGLIQQIRVLPERVYRFKHALTQEVAYDSLLLHQRKGLHQAAGEAIEHLYADRIEEQLELLVHHYSSAEDWERAARFGVDSADKASGLSRFAEALTMLERTEGWLMKLPDGSKRKEQLVRLLLKQERLAETLGLRERQQKLIDRLLSILDPGADRASFADVLVRQGELFTLLRRFDEAEQALDEALSIYRETDNASGERVALRTMGFLRWQQSRYEEAEDCNRTALSIDLAQDDRAGYAQDLTNLGVVLRGRGRLQEGLRCLDEAYRIHEEMRRPFNQVYTLDVMATLYRDLGDHDRAMNYYKRACETATRHRRHLQRRITMISMASLAWERGSIEESLRYSREVVDAARKLGLKPELATALATLSHRLLESQRDAEAMPLLREAADIFREVGDKDEEARTLTSFAYVRGRLGGVPDDSLTIWERIRELRREQCDSGGELEALEELASVSRLQSKKPELALEYLDQALLLATALDDSARVGDLLNTMGIVEWNRGDYLSAVERYERALEIFRAAGDQVHVGLMLNSLGVTLAKLGRSTEATDLLQEALSTHRTTGERLLEGHALAALGDIYAANSWHQPALDCYSESLEIRKAIGDRRGEGWMLYQLARLSKKTDAAGRVADLLAQASAIASEIGDEQLSSACAGLDHIQIEKE